MKYGDKRTYHSPFRAHKTKDKREIDRRTIEYNPEMPDEFSDDLKDLVNGLLQKKPSERLGHNGAQELMVRFKNPWTGSGIPTLTLESFMVQRSGLGSTKSSWLRSPADTSQG